MKRLLVAFTAVALLVLLSSVADAQTRGPRDSYPMAHHVAQQRAQQARQNTVNRHSGHRSGVDIRISPYRSHPRSLYYAPTYPRYIPYYSQYRSHCPPSYHYGIGYGSFSGFGVRVQW